nr:hypothetical protein [Tanacetum cinerariifolium]
DQAPAAPNGFSPQWIGEHDPNNNNGWIEWDVPLGGEVGGPSTAAIEGPSFPLLASGLPVPPTVIEDLGTRLGNLEYKHGVLMRKMEEVGGPSTAAIEGPSFPLLASGLHVPPTVIEDLGTRLGNLEYKHGVLMRKMEEVSDVEVVDSITIGGIHPRVAMIYD